MRVKYEERREYNAIGGYLFTNESLELTQQLVKDSGAKNIAAICSSGDLLLGVFAPNAQKCVAVDHSLQSIKTALTKAVLIEHLTGDELKRLLNDAASQYSLHKNDAYPPECPLQEAVREAIKELPPSVACQTSYYGDPFEVPAARWGVVWKSVTAKDIDATRERLDDIMVIHGDLRDLDGEKFDLLYLSNAMEHTGYDGQGPKLEMLADQVLVNEGFALFTATNPLRKYEMDWNLKFVDKNLKVELKHPEEMNSWFYHLAQRKKLDATTVKVTTPAT